jgi:hypothetical protein
MSYKEQKTLLYIDNLTVGYDKAILKDIMSKM